MRSLLVVTLTLSCTAARALEPVADFGSNPGNLLMHQHLPSSAGGALPLVLLLHGCGQDAEAFAADSGWIDLADELGLALVVAEQRTSNNFNTCFNWFEDGDITRGMGEAESLIQMIEHLRGTAQIDDARIFVTGLSSGGAMTAVLLAAYPERFAAGAIVAGVPYRCGVGLGDALACMDGERTLSAAQWGDRVRAASSHGGPWPRVMIWHGDDDGTVHVTNAGQSALQWSNVHGLPAEPTDEVAAGRDTVRRWTADDDSVRVEQHTVANMDHGWPVAPPGCGTTGAFLPDVDLCAAREIARFFGLLASAPDAGTTPDSGAAVDAGTSPDAAVPDAGADAGAPVGDAGDADDVGDEKPACACAMVPGELPRGAWLLLAFSFGRRRSRAAGDGPAAQA